VVSPKSASGPVSPQSPSTQQRKGNGDKDKADNVAQGEDKRGVDNSGADNADEPSATKPAMDEGADKEEGEGTVKDLGKVAAAGTDDRAGANLDGDNSGNSDMDISDDGAQPASALPKRVNGDNGINGESHGDVDDDVTSRPAKRSKPNPGPTDEQPSIAPTTSSLSSSTSSISSSSSSGAASVQAAAASEPRAGEDGPPREPHSDDDQLSPELQSGLSTLRTPSQAKAFAENLQSPQLTRLWQEINAAKILCANDGGGGDGGGRGGNDRSTHGALGLTQTSEAGPRDPRLQKRGGGVQTSQTPHQAAAMHSGAPSDARLAAQGRGDPRRGIAHGGGVGSGGAGHAGSRGRGGGRGGGQHPRGGWHDNRRGNDRGRGRGNASDSAKRGGHYAHHGGDDTHQNPGGHHT
jgi:hypothetical protein